MDLYLMVYLSQCLRPSLRFANALIGRELRP
jgi:hypothetical protein